jgi:molybdenum cofactor biosynthesis protein B
MGLREHKAKAPAGVSCMVITVSDSRTPESDSSGRLIQRLLKRHGHRVVAYHLVKDEPARIKRFIQKAPVGVEAILLSGGTGFSSRDRTYEAVTGLFEKRIDGFGELFRALSYREIGPAAMLSRATAGLYRGKLIFSLPGSAPAVRLGMEKLILPELGHLLYVLGQ